VDSNPKMRPSSPIDADISPKNQNVLLEIASLIRLAEGFRLGLVKCNQPVQCRQLADRLKVMLSEEAEIVDVVFNEPVQSLRKAILQKLEKYKPIKPGKRAVFIYGFEHSVPSEGPAPALDELNQSRDLFPGDFDCPLLLWLPDYALTRLAREAPDFWGWRSGVFEFLPDLKLMAAVEKKAMQDEETESLSLAKKRDLIAALEGLIRDYQELKRGEREDLALAATLHRLGNLRYHLGEYDEASRLYQESLKIMKELGDEPAVSASLHNLGALAQDQGNYEEARRYYEESLKIEKELGNRAGVSKSLNQLGSLAQAQGDYDAAMRYYEDSLKIKEELGDKAGISASLHNLGALARDQGNYEEARRYYEESLKIEKELGNRAGISKSLHQLGILAYLAGDYEEARHYYEDSLKIKKELGDKAGLAISLAQLALLEEKEGNLPKALQLIKRAEDMFQDLGSPYAPQARRDRERLQNINIISESL
jgi:tetratricopeptide (TPR) repeat protein